MNEFLRPLIGLMFGTKEQAQNQLVTIRVGHRDFRIGDKLIVGFEATGLFGNSVVTGSDQLLLLDVSSDSLIAAGLPGTTIEAVIALNAFYPGINAGSEVTVIAFSPIVMPEAVVATDKAETPVRENI